MNGPFRAAAALPAILACGGALAQGAEPQPGSREDLRRHPANEIEKWGT